MFGDVQIRERIGLPLLFVGGLVCLFAVYLDATTGEAWRYLGLVGILLILGGLKFGTGSP